MWVARQVILHYTMYRERMQLRCMFIYLFIYTYNDIHVYMAILVEVNMKNEITKTTMEGYG